MRVAVACCCMPRGVRETIGGLVYARLKAVVMSPFAFTSICFQRDKGRGGERERDK